MAGETDVQLRVQANAQGQCDIVWPPGQAAFDVGQAQFDVQCFTGIVELKELPFAGAHQPMGRCRLV